MGVNEHKRHGQASLYRYLAIVILVLLVPAAIYFKELRLAYDIFRHEGGQTAFGGNPQSAHFVGIALDPPRSTQVFVVAGSGNVGNASVLHPNGCFVVTAAQSTATLRSYAPGFVDAVTHVDRGGYFDVRFSLSPVDSGKPSDVSLAPISAWDFIRRTVRCVSSS